MDELRSQILIRLARATKAKAVADPVTDTPSPEGLAAPSPSKTVNRDDDVGGWNQQPVISPAGVTYGSAIWAHGNAQQKTKAESAMVLPNSPTSDKSNLLSSSAGFPRVGTRKAPPVWRDQAKVASAKNPSLGDNLMASLVAIHADPNTDYGQLMSGASADVRKVLVDSVPHFSTLRSAVSHHGPGFEKLKYISSSPALARMHQIRTALDSKTLDPDTTSALEEEYKGYVTDATALSERAKKMTVSSQFGTSPLIDYNEKANPLLPNDLGLTGSQSPSKRPGPPNSKAGSSGGEDSEKDDKDTLEAKQINHHLMAALNSDTFTLYRQMRDEARALEPATKKSLTEKYKALRPQIEKSFLDQIQSGAHPDSASLYTKKGGINSTKFKGLVKSHIESLMDQEMADSKEQHLNRVNSLAKLESALSAAHFTGSTLVNMANKDMRNFADWYDSGSTRTSAALVDYINKNPHWSMARGKFGNIESVGPDGKGKRLTFSSPEQAHALTVLMSIFGPTSANEKPSNNAKIAIGLLDEGMHRWHMANADNPEALAKGPSALDILAHAPSNKEAYGLTSAYKGQKDYKFWSGIYHKLDDDEKRKHGELFGALTKKDSDALKYDIGNYYKNDQGEYHLAPIEDIKSSRATLDSFVADQLAKAGLKGDKESAGILAEMIRRIHKDNPVGFENRVYTPKEIYLKTPEGRTLPSPLGISTRPGSTLKNLHLVRAFHRGLSALENLPGGLDDANAAEIVAQRVHQDPYKEDDFSHPKYLLEHLAGTPETRADMGYPKALPMSENAMQHSRNLANFLMRYKGQSKDAAYFDFLTSNFDHSLINSISPTVRPNYATIDEGGKLTHHGLNSFDDPKASGALVQGPKFGNFATSLLGAPVKARQKMEGGKESYLPYMTVDRVMMEDLMNATGQWYGGVPASELQRAMVHLGAMHAAKNLAKHFGIPLGALHFNKMQAAQWGAVQAANTAFGGNNPTEQLYTGVENAFREAKIKGRRLLKKYEGKALSPAEQQKLQEWRHFVDNEVPLNIESSDHGEAYANLHDFPFDATTQQYGGDLHYEGEQARLMEAMGKSGSGTLKQLESIRQLKKHFSRSTSDARTAAARHTGDRGVRAVQDADRGRPQQPFGLPRKAEPARHLRKQQEHAAPVHSLAANAPFAPQRGSKKNAGRDDSGARLDVPKARRAGGADGRAAVLKFSSQFMRSMMLGISASAKKFSGQINDIAKQIGVPVRTYTGVGDATSNSSPATAHISGAPMDPDTARYLAAWSGLLGGKRSVMVFHPDQKGTDSLYSIRLPMTNMQELRAALDRKGIQHRTIIPGEKHSHVFVYDPRRIMRPYVARLAEEHDGDVLESTGRSEFLGRPANSGSTDPLADSREHYRRIIADYEERRGVPNQAGTAANGGGGGASVSGDPAAGRSPSGGSIVRGVTYKGGSFTPAGEQKAPPAPKEGSPERFKKRKVKLNRAANIAQQGLDQTASSKVLSSPRLKSDAAANVAVAYNNSETSHSDSAGSLSKPLFNYAGRQNGFVGVSAPTGDGEQGVQHQPSEEPTTEALYSAAANANGIQSDTPVAYNSDMNAIRHMLQATAKQRVTPYQRYEGAKALAPDRSSRERIDKMCDSIQRLVGSASHGTSQWIKSLSQESRPINHDVELADGVTRLNGVILPYDDHHELLQHVVHREDETLPSEVHRQMILKDRPFLRRYVPTKPVQYGLLDYLHDAPGGQPLYGTPDGNVFLDPAIANFHVNDNRGILKYHGNVFMPWHNIQDRVQRYTGVDHLIDKIANDDTLYRMEKRPQHIHNAMAGSLNPSIIKELLGTMQAEPGRVQRLLSLLGDNLGVQSKDTSFHTAYGTGPKLATPLGAINGRVPSIGTGSPLGAAFGGSPVGVTKMANSIHNLFHHFRQNDPKSMAHVATFTPMDEDELGTMGYHTQRGFNPETRSPIMGSEHGTMFEPDAALPFSMINMSQLATPITLAHEIGHHISANIPGIERSVMEHAFANSNGGVEKRVDENGRPDFRWKNLNTQWASSKDRQSYAKRIYPGLVAYAAPWNNGPRRLNHFNGSNEYLSTMMEEFFARPVAMARTSPMTVRFLLGLMNGALRNHR